LAIGETYYAEQSDSEDSLLDQVQGEFPAPGPAPAADAAGKPTPAERRAKQEAKEQEKAQKQQNAAARATLTLSAKVLSTLGPLVDRLAAVVRAAAGTVAEDHWQLRDCRQTLQQAERLQQEAQVVLSKRNFKVQISAADMHMDAKQFTAVAKSCQNQKKALAQLLQQGRAKAKAKAKASPKQ